MIDPMLYLKHDFVIIIYLYIYFIFPIPYFLVDSCRPYVNILLRSIKMVAMLSKVVGL